MTPFTSHFSMTVITKPEEDLDDVLQPHLAKREWQGVIGGRWSNFLINTRGESVDSALINEVDFTRMYDVGVTSGQEEWTIFKKISDLKGDWVRWDDYWAKSKKDIYNAIPLLAHYKSQHDVQLIKNAFNTDDFKFIDQFHTVSKQYYIHLRGDDHVVTSALLYNNLAIECGNLNKETWHGLFLSRLLTAPQDCTITIVDCSFQI